MAEIVFSYIAYGYIENLSNVQNAQNFLRVDMFHFNVVSPRSKKLSRF